MLYFSTNHLQTMHELIDVQNSKEVPIYIVVDVIVDTHITYRTGLAAISLRGDEH